MSARLGHYLRVYAGFWRTCLLAELEFRGHFLLMAGVSLLWSGASLAMIGLIFRNVRSVGGWSEAQMWLLTSTFLLTTSLANLLISRNMSEMTRLINRGEFDFVLTRPLNSQFIISARYVDLKQAPSVLLALAVVLVAAQRAGVPATAGHIGLYLALVLAGLLIIYALWFLSCTLIVFSGRVNNIAALMHALLDVARVPTHIYGPLAGRLLTLVLPFAFVATVPASALLGLLDWRLAAYGGLATVALLAASHRFWQFALRHYASASS